MLSILLVIGRAGARRAGASPPSRTNSMIFLYIYIYIFIYIRSTVRRALNLLRASFSPIFQYFSAVNVTRVSFSPVFQYFVTYVYVRIYVIHTCTYAMRHGIVGHGSFDVRHGFFGPEGRVLNKGRRDSERRLAYRERTRARRGSETAAQRKLD